MRTTFNTINRNTQYVIGKRYSDLADLQKKIATGKELLRPSDSPVDVSNVLTLRSNNNMLKQNEKNIHDGLSWLGITDTTMVSMNKILQRGRELAIQGDSDTLSSNERKYIAEEIEQLTRQMISLTNSRFKGRYIFSGSHTDKAPTPISSSKAEDRASYTNYEMSYFDGTGAIVGSTFQIYSPEGSSQPSDRKPLKNILPGSLTIKVGNIDNNNPTVLKEGEDYTIDYLTGKITIQSTNAATLLGRDYTPSPGNVNYGDGTSPNNLQLSFDYASESKDIYGNPINTNSRIYREIESGVKVAINTTVQDITVDGVNAITSMIHLGDALINNNKTEIQKSMDELDLSFNTILSAQSKNGAKTNLFDTTNERNENQQVETTRIQSELEDADYAQVVSDYSVAQTVFDAALKSTSKIMQSSLADYV